MCVVKSVSKARAEWHFEGVNLTYYSAHHRISSERMRCRSRVRPSAENLRSSSSKARSRIKPSRNGTARREPSACRSAWVARHDRRRSRRQSRDVRGGQQLGKNADWRRPMRQAAGLVAITMTLGFGLRAAPADPTATVAQGVLAGTIDNGVTAFFGVPFAAPPLGELRWAPPRPPASWGSQPRSAKTFGAACTQTLRSAGSGQWTTEYMSPEAPAFPRTASF